MGQLASVVGLFGAIGLGFSVWYSALPIGLCEEVTSRFCAVAAHRDQPVARVSPGMVLHAGDALRFVYRAPASGFLAIFDADTRGASTLYPYRMNEAAAVRPGPSINKRLPTRVELDNSTGPERFIAVFSSSPFRLEPILEALRRGQREPLSCDGCTVDTITIEKH